jgi:molybdopterin/thiamine biosynthesis adenylyltransferase
VGSRREGQSTAPAGERLPGGVAFSPLQTSLGSKSALLVGVGGLGSPAAIALSRAGIGTLAVADDDEVELGNLHRQILFGKADVGARKTQAAERAIRAWAGSSSSSRVCVVVHDTRVLPSNAVDLVSRYDVVVEGSDNFATKFLVADACAIAKTAVVHGAAVRWHGTVLAVGPRGAPCYRCLFEDLPRDHAPNCAEAGVIGPMVGVVGALQADLVIAALEGRGFGTLVTFDGKADQLRRRSVAARSGCSLCGAHATPTAIDPSRYVAAGQGDWETPPSSLAP